MNDIIFEDIKSRLLTAYNNLFLVAIERKCNFIAAIESTEKMIEDYFEANTGVFHPRGFDGLLFISILAKEIGVSFHDVLYMSDVEKESIIRGITEQIPVSSIRNVDFDYDKNEDTTSVSHLLTTHDSGEDVYYKLEFMKYPDEDNEGEYEYSLEITLTSDGMHYGVETDYVYDRLVVYKSHDGAMMDFFDEISTNMPGDDSDKDTPAWIESLRNINDEEQEMSEDSEREEEQSDKEKENHNENIEVVHKENETIDEKTGKRIIEELVTYVFNDTKSIGLLDKFEGYGEDAPIYKRIVIKNTMYSWSLGLKNHAGVNLVIERSISKDYTGDITFTEFKQDKSTGLREFLKSEITDDVADNYLDTDAFFRFSKPYRLRAQNSGNRTGYGSIWDWTGGEGICYEGTLYGETTDYVFVGAYISSMSKPYSRNDRKPFAGKQIDREKKYNGYTIQTYQGKLSRSSDIELVQRYIRVLDNRKNEKYLPVLFDELNNTIYMTTSLYNKYLLQLKREICLLEDFLKGPK